MSKKFRIKNVLIYFQLLKLELTGPLMVLSLSETFPPMWPLCRQKTQKNTKECHRILELWMFYRLFSFPRSAWDLIDRQPVNAVFDKINSWTVCSSCSLFLYCNEDGEVRKVSHCPKYTLLYSLPTEEGPVSLLGFTKCHIVLFAWFNRNCSCGRATLVSALMPPMTIDGEVSEGSRKVLAIVFLLEVFNDWDIASLWVQTVQFQTPVSGQRSVTALQPGLLLFLVPLIVEIDRHCPLGQGEFRVEPQIRGQFALNWRCALELVGDLNANTSTSLFELRWDICRPLCGMSTDLSHLQVVREKERRKQTGQRETRGWRVWFLNLLSKQILL